MSQTPKIDGLASVRARLGWEVQSGLLAYGTAGLGFGHFQYDLTQKLPFVNVISGATALEGSITRS
jgi:opacity protein-like surface antigen